MSYLNRFVGAKLKGMNSLRQGVVIEQTADTLILLGESGERYQCDPDHVAVVAMRNLWGSTRAFAIKQGVRE